MLSDLSSGWRSLLGVVGAGLVSVMLATMVLLLPPVWFAGILSAGFFLAMLWFGRARIALMALTGASMVLDSFTDVTLLPLSSRVGVNVQGALSLLALLGFSYYVLMRNTDVLSRPLVKPWLVFLLVIPFSFSVTPSLLVSIRELTRLAVIFMVFVLAAESGPEDRDARVFVAFLLGMTLIQLSLGLSQWTRQTGLNEYSLITPGLFRIQGTFYHPTSYASFLHIPLLVSLALFSRTRGLASRVILVAGIFLMVLSLFLTYTRTAWISFAIALGLYGYLRSRKMLAIALLTGLLAVVFVPQIMTRFEDLQTWDWRVAQWQQYWDYFLQKPVTGHGLGVTLRIGGVWSGPNPDTHNDFLRMAVETGVGGGIAYLGLIVACVRQAWAWYGRAHDEWSQSLAAAFLTLTVAYMIVALTTNILRDTVVQWLFWEFAGVISSMTSQTWRGAET